MSGRHVMVLGAQTMQIPLFDAARSLGLSVLAADPNPSPDAAAAVDEVEVVDLADLDGLREAARRWRPAAICTFAADFPVLSAASLCRELGLPGLSYEAASLSTNKAAMYAALSSAGVPMPRGRTAATWEAASRVRGELGSDVIVKPVDSSGGRGVSLVTVEQPDSELRDAVHRAMSDSRLSLAFVQEYVEGPEYSVEAITVDGRTHVVAVTDKTTTGAPCFVEIAHSQPSALSAEVQERIGNVAAEAISALGIDASPSHTEIRLGAQGPTVIEIGARCGGGFICSHLVPLSCGVDMARAALQMSLGDTPECEPTRSRGAAVRFFSAKPGRLASIRGIEEARALEGVREIRIEVRPGERIGALRDARDRFGCVICEADTAQAAAELCGRASDLIVFETESR